MNLVAKGRKIKIAIYNKYSPKIYEDDEYQKNFTFQVTLVEEMK